MNYNFPRIKYADTNTAEEQLEHIKSECLEIIERIDNGDFQGLTEEIIDRMHSSESWLRIVSERHGVDVDAEIEKVIEKNRARGYYDD